MAIRTTSSQQLHGTTRVRIRLTCASKGCTYDRSNAVTFADPRDVVEAMNKVRELVAEESAKHEHLNMNKPEIQVYTGLPS